MRLSLDVRYYSFEAKLWHASSTSIDGYHEANPHRGRRYILLEHLEPVLTQNFPIVPEHNDSYVPVFIQIFWVGHPSHHSQQYFLGTYVARRRIFAPDLFNLYFQYTNPPSALGFWIALEKCTASNGALSFLPGSHLTTPITKRFVRLADNKGTGMVPLTSLSSDKLLPQVQKGEYILEPCNPGQPPSNFLYHL